MMSKPEGWKYAEYNSVEFPQNEFV